MIKMSVIILSYNTRDYTLQCLTTLWTSLQGSEHETEIIVIDNASVDDSVAEIKHFIDKHKNNNIDLKLIENEMNSGFTKGNNQGEKLAKGEYILFLNSDITIENVDFKKILGYMDENRQVGALTVKVLLPQGQIDPASHRGFPTPWNSFCYFLKLEKIFGKIPLANRLFGGYHLTYLNMNKPHEIDSPTGAFFLTRKDLFNRLGRFDETFMMYGEDIDLAYRIRGLGFKIEYLPEYLVIHHKHKSGLSNTSNKIRKQTKKYFYEAMKIFYRKHYADKYPDWLNKIVFTGISLKQKL